MIRTVERGTGNVQHLEIACQMQNAAGAEQAHVTITVADVTRHEDRRQQGDQASVHAQRELETVRNRVDEISGVNRELLKTRISN